VTTDSPFVVAGEAILFGDDDDFSPGWLKLVGGRIAEVGRGPYPGRPDWISPHHIAPGLVDTHCHGGGGASYSAADAQQAETVLATHRQAGTTTQVASLVTASLPDLLAQIAALRPLVESGDLAGVHLEGPWLAPSRKGAHNPRLLSAPLPAAVDAVLAQRDVVRMVTIAPELPGALAAIERLAAAGIVAAVGHTDADYDMTRAAIAAGARGATHLFNAMPALLHRAPGPVLALLEDDRVRCELIIDQHHIHPALACAVARLLGRRAVLVTDAMAATGLGDGRYDLGGLPVEVRGGIARLADHSTIAGSTIKLADALRHAVAGGVLLPEALAAATRQGADYLSLSGVGRLQPGARADLVEVTADGIILRTLHRGQWV
jgi:N-acetylglucosamine-6-phosphate deacetylase